MGTENNSYTLAFILQKGSFTTSVLREVMEVKVDERLVKITKLKLLAQLAQLPPLFLCSEHLQNVCRLPVCGFQLLSVLSPRTRYLLHVGAVDFSKYFIGFNTESTERTVSHI